MRHGDSSDSDDSYEDRKRKSKKKHKKHGSSDSSDDDWKKSKSKKPSSFGKRGNPLSGKRWLTFLLPLEQCTHKQHSCLHYTSAILCTIYFLFYFF